MRLRVEVSFEHNESEITVVRIDYPTGGKPEIEDSVRKLTDRAKAQFIEALNA
jgi:uncharacterized protein YqgV (UPF0045/DUF77 family)